MGVNSNRIIAFIILFILTIPLSLGITDSLSAGQSKTYTINNNNFEITCVNGNENPPQISTYSINGQLFGFIQGQSSWKLPGDVILRNLGFSGGSCQFVMGLVSDPALCNECATEHERWCGHSGYWDGDPNRIWSCEDYNGCLKVANYNYCKSPQICSNGQCVTPSGCLTNNPPCDSGYQCVNNQCIKQCNDGNICEGNYVYHQTTDCNKQQIKFCQWGCNNFGDCSGAPPGCTYNNPACPSNYNCVNNQCVQQNPTGCAYHNPDCSSGYDCVNNACIKRQIGCEQRWACKDDFNKEFIYSDCSISSITYCPYGCSSGNCKSTPSGCRYNNPPCVSGYACSNNQCIEQQKSGCAYHNPDCNSGYDCINNVCAKKQQVITCQQGWKCKDLNNCDFTNNKPTEHQNCITQQQSNSSLTGVVLTTCLFIPETCLQSLASITRIATRFFGFGESGSVAVEDRITASGITKESETVGLTNFQKGQEWEKIFVDVNCKFKKCFYSSIPPINYEGEYSIIGGKATNSFIREHPNLFYGKIAETFMKEPDSLKVTRLHGEFRKIDIVDAKLSLAATRPEQDEAFKLLCENAKIPCSVVYDIPKETANQKGISCINVITEGSDSICEILAYSKN